MKTLGEVRDRMIEIVGRPELLSFVNARLVLRTGVSLNNISPNHTLEELSRVVAALNDMGYALERQGVKK